MTRSVLRTAVVSAVLAATVLAAGAGPAAGFTNGDIKSLWLLNEGSGQTIRDSKGNNSKGTLGSTAGADANDPTWVAGSAGTSALGFNGDDFVDIQYAPLLDYNAVTLAAVVRAPASPGQFRYVAGKGASACQAASYALYSGASGGLFFYVSDGQTYTLSPDAGQSVWDGQWHSIVGTYDGATVRLYVDGQQVGSGVPSTLSVLATNATSDRFAVGAYRGTCSLYFVGDIDGVAVLRKAVSSSELGAVRDLAVGR